MSAGAGPCNGELQFWAVMRTQMMQQSKQLTRIANILAARNQAENIPLVPNAEPARVPDGLAVGSKVIWEDAAGKLTRGWEVVRAPDPDEDGNVPEDGLYVIRCAARGAETEVLAGELVPDRPGGRA